MLFTTEKSLPAFYRKSRGFLTSPQGFSITRSGSHSLGSLLSETSLSTITEPGSRSEQSSRLTTTTGLLGLVEPGQNTTLDQLIDTLPNSQSSDVGVANEGILETEDVVISQLHELSRTTRTTIRLRTHTIDFVVFFVVVGTVIGAVDIIDNTTKAARVNGILAILPTFFTPTAP